ncbi:hepatic lectin-like [Megalobrama amblycephala]|uniref:hepatic lectin-like n=1 Tax=Megalobrama amblycephala TaxID=75352 RepID=UPI002013C52D|nr:hepatic lectin-like [Megalobrama amblycephala]
MSLSSALSSSVNSHLFYFISEKMNWSDAQTYCRQNHIDLTTVDDQEDLISLVENVPKGFNEYMWIGLYRITGTSPWIWSDQSHSAFRLWIRGQPNNSGGNQMCVQTTSAGEWNDWWCVEKLAFICYAEKKRQIVRLEVKSSRNVNDLAVRNQILQKILQILTEKGLKKMRNCRGK